MRVFVTGAAGFIGSHIVERLLVEGHEVRAVVRDIERARAALPAAVELSLGDVRDLESLVRTAGRVDCVVHAAARVSDWGAWSEFQATTVQGTDNVLEAARRAGAATFVLISSTAVYDAAAIASGHVTEDAPLTRDKSAGNRYGYSKALAEQRAFAAHLRGDFHVTALRPAWVYGPNDRSMLPRIIDFVRDPSSRWVKGHNPELGLVHATDLALAVSLAATTPAASGLAFNISAVEPYRLLEYADRIAEFAGVRAPSRSVPLALAKVAAALFEDTARLLRRKEPPALTRFALACMIEGNPFDVTRAKEVLAWKPRVPHGEGIAQMLEWAQSLGMI